MTAPLLFPSIEETSLFYDHGVAEKRGVIGSEVRRIATEDLLDCPVLFEFSVKKTTDVLAVPAEGMLKIQIYRQISLIKIGYHQLTSLLTADRQIEDGQIEKTDLPVVLPNEAEGLACLLSRLSRSAEEQKKGA